MRRLRFQLIALLVLAMLIPLLPAGYAARELFRRSLEPMIAAGLPEASDAALAVTREAIEAVKARWLADMRAGVPLDTLSAAEVAALGLDTWPPRSTASTPGPARGLTMLREPELVSADSAARLVAEVAGPGGVSTWVTRLLPDTLARRAVSIQRAARLLNTLRRERETLLSGLLKTFLVVTVGLGACVLGLGLLLLSRLTHPLAELSRGIDRVAAGDLAARVPERGSAELTALVQRFNTMAGRLETQQAELARLERLAAWRQMARFLAHEIKNPLTPIQLAAEQMRDAYRGDDPAYRKLVDEGASIIQEEVAGLRSWVGEFSQFARLPEVHPAPVAAADLAEELGALYGAGALAVRGDGATLWCDRDQLKRVLVNLIDNARASQREAGSDTPVELSFTATAGGGVAVRVRDHGTGIAPEKRQRVFEPDYTTKSDGMGLGLAIVENIVRQHGGTIAVVDTQGVGATIEITLPARTEGATT